MPGYSLVFKNGATLSRLQVRGSGVEGSSTSGCRDDAITSPITRFTWSGDFSSRTRVRPLGLLDGESYDDKISTAWEDSASSISFVTDSKEELYKAESMVAVGLD